MQGMVVVGLIVEELSNINVKFFKYRSRSLGHGTCQARAMSLYIEEKHYARFDGCRPYS